MHICDMSLSAKEVGIKWYESGWTKKVPCVYLWIIQICPVVFAKLLNTNSCKSQGEMRLNSQQYWLKLATTRSSINIWLVSLGRVSRQNHSLSFNNALLVKLVLLLAYK